MAYWYGFEVETGFVLALIYLVGKKIFPKMKSPFSHLKVKNIYPQYDPDFPDFPDFDFSETETFSEMSDLFKAEHYTG